MRKLGGVSWPLIICLLIIFGGLLFYLLQGKSTINLPGITPPAPTANRALMGAKIVGIMGAYLEDFAFIKSWGANTVHIYKNPGSTIAVGAALSEAKKNGMSLMASVAKINQFDDSFDITSLETNSGKYIPDFEQVASDPAFLGYWIIDEPCNSKKRSPVQAQDLRDLYLAVKGINPGIGLVINFGNLECLQGFVETSQPGWKLTDVAMFTITEKKLKTKPDYISEQASLATSIKTFDPNIIVLPQIGAVEYKEKGQPFPPAAWIQSTGLATLAHFDSFDGLLYYSFHSYENVKFIGQSISDFKNDPAYASAFKTVFQQATK